MTKQNVKLSGVIPPMITPLTENRKLDVDGLSRLLNHLEQGGVSGVFVMGSSGEGPWLTADMQAALIRETRKQVGDRLYVLAGALEPSTDRTLETISRHADSGADAVVITSPYYFGAGASEQIKHIETLVTQSPIPVMLYNIPPTTHNPIAPQTVAQVTGLDNLLGIKDSAGDWDNFLALLKLRSEHPEFVVFQGAEKLAAKSMLAGADGIVPGLGNLVPEWFVKIVTCVTSGDNDQAQEIQQNINDLWKLHTYDYWLVCLKYAGSLSRFGSGTTIGHVSNLSAQDQQAIRDLVSTISVHTGA